MLEAFGGAVPEPLLVLVDGASGLLREVHELGAGATSLLWAPTAAAGAEAGGQQEQEVTVAAPRSLLFDKVVRGPPSASRFALPLQCSGTPEAGGAHHLLTADDVSEEARGGAFGDGGTPHEEGGGEEEESWWHAHLSQLVGYFAAANIALLQVPQLYKTAKARSAMGLSWGTIALNSSNGLLWLGYGFVLSQPPIVIANSMYCLANALLVACKWSYDGGAQRRAAAATSTPGAVDGAAKVTAAKAAVGGECGLAEARTRGVVAL